MKCQICVLGEVVEKEEKNHKTTVLGQELTIPEAIVGRCDTCGTVNYAFRKKSSLSWLLKEGDMKFHIGTDNELIAERADLQPAFVKGAVAAHLDKPEENPYQRGAYRNAWELGYQGVKQGKVVIEDE